MAKKKKVAIAKVRGAWPFPLDMLRYDNAYPLMEEDSLKIEGSFRERAPKRFEVKVVCHRGPTVGRWESFGWSVVEEVYRED